MSSRLFVNKMLLITDVARAFGNAALNYFLCTDIGESHIISCDKKKQYDMRYEFQTKMPKMTDKIKFYIGDVRDIGLWLWCYARSELYVPHCGAEAGALCEFFDMQLISRYMKC